jgi:hypothetical protein
MVAKKPAVKAKEMPKKKAASAKAKKPAVVIAVALPKKKGKK